MLSIKKAAKWLWDSPTFTTWGNYGIQSLRLLLVTPLILTRFDETEIAAWYLFASLNFFGTIIGQRLGLTFSRMFAFAMGGASNLAPIKGAREQENDGQPNWKAFERAYGTVGSLNFGIAWLNVLIALGMGWFGLNNLLDGYEAKATIWLSFAVMQATALVGFIYQRYSIALVGMNYVALSNRWNIIFSLLSVIAGSVTLYLSDNLLVLVGVMQSLSLLGLVRAWLLLRSVEEGRVARMKSYSFDREVFGWAWEPTWKGLIWNFAVFGNMQITGIIYTSFANPDEVGTMLFCLRIMQTINEIAQVPFMSKQPYFSRLMGAGDLENLYKVTERSIICSMCIASVGIILAGAMLPFFLVLVGSNICFLNLDTWLIFGYLSMLVRLLVWTCSISAIGNNVIFYWEALLSSCISISSLLLCAYFQDQISPLTPILTSLLPFIIILNLKPFRRVSAIFDKHLLPEYFWKTLLILALFGFSSFILI